MIARPEANVPALGLVVQRRDDKPTIAVDGLRVAGGKRKVTTDHLWHWGSIGKSMTATLAARLVERGVVAWDDTIGQRLGNVVPSMRDEYRDVTLSMLLSHRSGMPANIPVEQFANFASSPAEPIPDRLAWVKIALAQEPEVPKKETYHYSNNGYIVAGAMLGSATGRSWEDLMRKEVFGPLNLASAGFGAPAAADPNGQPRGHRSILGADAPVAPDADNPPALGPAGRIHMSLADIATYLTVHATRRESFLSKETYDRLHTASFGGFYALGWVVTDEKRRWHNGSNNSWDAEATFNLENGTVAAVVVNDGDIKNVQPTVRKLIQTLTKKSD
ncbi:MAG: serine hydrolase domain-containing protein [Planctomycetota bacterium]